MGDRKIDDVEGALNVGMRGVWRKADYPWPSAETITPSATISTLAELLPLLEAWA